MNYSKDLFEYAFGVLSERRRNADTEAAERRKELCAHLPRLGEIEEELARTGIALVRAVVAPDKELSARVDALRKQNLALQAESAEILQSAGFSADYLHPQYVCTKCSDQGYVGTKLCSCMEELMRKEQLRRLNAVSSLPLSGFESFALSFYPNTPDEQGVVPAKRMAEVFQVCKQFAQSFPNRRNLLLIGKTGLGKTHLSLSIAAKVIDRGHCVVYGSVMDLFRQVEAERFSREGSKYTTLDTMLECDLLVLDDLGSEMATAFSNSVLYNLINTRINAGLSTIINTNLSMTELLSAYSERIVSRLMGAYSVLRFAGKDIRLIKQYKA